MFEDLDSVPEDEEIDFSLLEDLDEDDSDGGGLGALRRKRRKRSTTTGGVRKTRKAGRRAYTYLRKRKKRAAPKRRRKVARKAAPKRRKRRPVVGSTRRRPTRRRRASVAPRRRRRRRSTVAGLAQLIAKAAPARRRRRRRRGTTKGQIRKSARKAFKGTKQARRARRRRRLARRPIRRAKRQIRRTRRRAARRPGLLGLGRLGNFSPKEQQPIIGGFNWAFGGNEGRMSLAGVILGTATNTLVAVGADKFLGKQKWYKDLVEKDRGWAIQVGVAAISSIAGWEIGKLAKSKDMSKFAFLYPWARLFDDQVVQKLAANLTEEKGSGAEEAGATDGMYGYGGGFGQLRVPDATELDGLSQLRVPDATELDGVSDYDDDLQGAGVGQYETETEDEESNVF